MSAESNPPGDGLARSASILAAGNLVSRVLGLVREIVIAALFGATGQVSAFRVAAQVPILLYDFLIGGMLSGALVPVLSDYARRGRLEFGRLVSALTSVFVAILTLLVLLIELTAPQLAWLLAGGFAATDQALVTLTTQLIRLLAPVVWFLSLGGVAMAVLYALQRFTAPALATAIFNLGIVVTAPLLAPHIGIFSLAIGLLAGSLAQMALMSGDVWRAGVRPSLRIDWRHPALRRILILYLPIAASLVVSLFQVGLDRRLASGVGESSIAWMANATTLQQMPLGLISVAISLAALPRLSQYYAARDEAAYRQTLARGLRLLWLLIVPAAVILWLLGEPITRILFQRGAFTAADTQAVVAALNIYLLGMVLAAVDYPLNFAFYARNNTLLPALVGIASVAVYTIVALTLVTPLGYLGLVWADTAKQGAHVVIMLVMLWRTIGRLHAHTVRGYGQIMLAGSAMALAMALTMRVLGGLYGPDIGQALVFTILVASPGVALYGLLLWRLQLPEVALLVATMRRRLPTRAPR